MKKEFYAIAMLVSEDEQSMCSLVQEGTGNTKKTSNLVERWFPYSPMKHIITNEITDEGYVIPQQLFKVCITEEVGKIQFEYFAVEPTAEIEALFIKPNNFKGLDTSFLHEG